MRFYHKNQPREFKGAMVVLVGGGGGREKNV